MQATDYQYVKLKSDPGAAVEFDLRDRIVGEILPDHGQDGKWRVNRIEDTVFLMEAFAERCVTRTGSFSGHASNYLRSAINHLTLKTYILSDIVSYIKQELESTDSVGDFGFSPAYYYRCWCGDFSSLSDMADATGKTDPADAWPTVYPALQIDVQGLQAALNANNGRGPDKRDYLTPMFDDLATYGGFVAADKAICKRIDHNGNVSPNPLTLVGMQYSKSTSSYYGVDTQYSVADSGSSVSLNAPTGADATGGKLAILYYWQHDTGTSSSIESGTGWKVLDLASGPSLSVAALSANFMESLIPGGVGNWANATSMIRHALAFYTMGGLRTALTPPANQ